MLNKVKNFITNIKTKSKEKIGKAVVAFGLIGSLVVGGASSAVYASEGAVTAGSLDFTPIANAMTSAISPTDIITVIAATIAAGAAFVVAWFGIRKVKGALSKGIFKGKF